jgi:hypothetical protein
MGVYMCDISVGKCRYMRVFGVSRSVMLNIMDGIVGTDCNLEVGDAEIGQF